MEKMHHMDYECHKPTDQQREAYEHFMFNPNNAYNCNECPERGNGNECTLPCGQQNCWVVCHCERN